VGMSFAITAKINYRKKVNSFITVFLRYNKKPCFIAMMKQGFCFSNTSSIFQPLLCRYAFQE
jgi:hypothetical protein